MKTLFAISTLLMLAGCIDAGEVNKNGEHDYVDRVYRTGSNIPTKTSPQADGVQVMERDEVERFQIERLPQGNCNPLMGCGKPGGH